MYIWGNSAFTPIQGRTVCFPYRPGVPPLPYKPQACTLRQVLIGQDVTFYALCHEQRKRRKHYQCHHVWQRDRKSVV